MRYRFGTLALCIVAFASACGGDSPTAPPPPPPAPPPSNRPPVITSVEFTPAFGIAYLTQFSFAASASDPDGDAITYAWDVAGNPSAAANGTIAFNTAGNGTARLTVTDGKGGTATESRNFVVGSMTGTWNGSYDVWLFTSTLAQNGTAITGNYADQLGPGRLDPAVANTIDANGNVKLRYKQATFSDFTFTGTMDSTGRRITGVVNGSGFVNTPFTMTKQ